MTDEQETTPAPTDAAPGEPAAAQEAEPAAEAPPEEEVEEEKMKVNRREFLNIAWLASLGIVTVFAGGVTYFFALPRFQAGEFGGEFIVQPQDIPPADAGPESDPVGRFWLSRSEPGVNALYVVCTHLGCLYGWLDDQGFFRCPCHGSQFFKQGEYKAGPAPRSLDQFMLSIVDKDSGEVIAQLNPETMDPVPLPDGDNYTIVVDTGNKIDGLPK
ncbi:MAG: Rieske 2Fe-2S domain-containing protein [Anaerolineales bacterium]|nr:Rieske 2Fe-2S domain-containing protein [Anaerolineales bacterium]